MANAVGATPPYVEEVEPNSPAAKSGLRPDDLIVYVDGELIPTIKAFKDYMRQVGPGTKIRMEVQRANRLQTVTVDLIEQPRKKGADQAKTP